MENKLKVLGKTILNTINMQNDKFAESVAASIKNSEERAKGAFLDELAKNTEKKLNIAIKHKDREVGTEKQESYIELLKIRESILDDTKNTIKKWYKEYSTTENFFSQLKSLYDGQGVVISRVVVSEYASKTAESVFKDARVDSEDMIGILLFEADDKVRYDYSFKNIYDTKEQVIGELVDDIIGGVTCQQ